MPVWRSQTVIGGSNLVFKWQSWYMTCLDAWSPLCSSWRRVTETNVDWRSGLHSGYLTSLGDDINFSAVCGGIWTWKLGIPTFARWPLPERLPILDNIVEFQENKVIPFITRHSFWSKRLSITSLLDFLPGHNYMKTGTTTSLSMWFQKAFDKVSQELLNRLMLKSIRIFLTKIRDWFAGRKQELFNNHDSK